MKLSTILPTSAFMGLVLTASLAFAQGANNPPPAQGGMGAMGGMGQQGGGMGQGGMGMGGMGQQGGGTGQGGMGMMGMGGMGQGGGKQGGCGMMNNMAALQERVNQLEQRLSSGQAQPPAPAPATPK